MTDYYLQGNRRECIIDMGLENRQNVHDFENVMNMTQMRVNAQCLLASEAFSDY